MEVRQARKFAQGHKDADDRIKNILETAFFLGEQHIVTKIMNHFMSKEEQKTMKTKEVKMKLYTGTKQVMAEPMNELTAVDKGFACKNEDNHEWREGYHVQYANPDGSTYDSWLPKQVFKHAYYLSLVTAGRGYKNAKTAYTESKPLNTALSVFG